MFDKMFLMFVSVVVFILVLMVSKFLWIVIFLRVILKSLILRLFYIVFWFLISEYEMWLLIVELYWGNGVGLLREMIFCYDR